MVIPRCAGEESAVNFNARAAAFLGILIEKASAGAAFGGSSVLAVYSIGRCVFTFGMNHFPSPTIAQPRRNPVYRQMQRPLRAFIGLAFAVAAQELDL